MVDLVADLNRAYPAAPRRSWLFVTERIMEAHRDQAILLYSRSS